MKTTLHFVILAFAGFGILASQAVAGESAADMDKHLCSICHGPEGTTTNELFPQLAKQPKDYLVSELKEFKDHTRFDENAKRFMWGIASRLSDSDIEALADFYSAQEVTHLRKIKNQVKYDRGQSIFKNGIVDKGVPACFSCHGENAEGHDNIARLGGQNENYLIRQLRAFHQNARETGHVMNFVAGALTDDDLLALAHFLQAQ